MIERSTILIADDNPSNLDVLLKCLSRDNHRVLVAEDGASAIERARQAQPDLILLDVMMPGLDGFETCTRLRADPSTQHIPIIFMTALGELDERKPSRSSRLSIDGQNDLRRRANLGEMRTQIRLGCPIGHIADEQTHSHGH